MSPASPSHCYGSFEATVDAQVAYDDDPFSGGWYQQASTSGFFLGENTVFARAIDGDGAWSNVVSDTVIVYEGGGKGFTFNSTVMCRGWDPKTYEPLGITDVFGRDDDEVDAWIQIDDVDVPVRFRVQWYRPNGDLWGGCESTWYEPPPDGWEWFRYVCWYMPSDDPGFADWDGDWTVRFAVDSGSGWAFQSTETFTMDFRLGGHVTARDVLQEDPWTPVDPTTLLYQTDQSVYSWVELQNVALGLEVRWRFYEPNGSLYYSDTYKLNEPPDHHWDWYRIWRGLSIAGSGASEKCGDWVVRVDVRDPFGAWEEELFDEFQILEAPNVPPSGLVYLESDPPIEGKPVIVHAEASDNTYLDRVELWWSDGDWHVITMADGLNAPSFADAVSLGAFPAGETLSLYLRATDTSGNVYETAVEERIVQPAGGEPPSISVLEDEPDPALFGESVNLDAYGVNDPEGLDTIERIVFYVDTNGGGWDESDQVLCDVPGNGGETYYCAWQPPSWGSFTYYARAQDNTGLWSNVVTTTGEVHAVPTIDSLVVQPSLITRGMTTVATAVGVDDPDGSGSDPESVTFLVDGVVIGTDSKPSNGWSHPVETSKLTPGQHVVSAKATDADGHESNLVQAPLEVIDPGVRSWASGSGGGVFQDGGNWDPAVAPGPEDFAVFGPDVLTKTVTFDGPATSRRLEVDGQAVSLDLAGQNLQLLEPTSDMPSLRIGTQPVVTSLTIENGSISGFFGTIGEATGSDGTLNVGSGGFLELGERTSVGERGMGTLNVVAGGQASAAQSLHVGRFDGAVGKVDVTGPGSALSSGALLVVGNFGTGILELTDQASFTGSAARFARKVGGTATVTLDSSAWTGLDMAVGGSETEPGGVADLTLGNGSTLTLTDFLTVWPQGHVVVGGGSQLNAVTLGNEGFVGLGGTGSTLTVSSLSFVGDHGSGVIEATEGAEVWSALRLGRFADGEGHVVVVGGATWHAHDVAVGGGERNGDGEGAGGVGTLLVDGFGATGETRLEVTDWLLLWPQGTLTTNQATLEVGGLVDIGGQATAVDSYWNTGNLVVGWSEPGSLQIGEQTTVLSNGGSTVGLWEGSCGAQAVILGGSSWSLSGGLHVGNQAVGSLELGDFSTINVGTDAFVSRWATGAGSTVHIFGEASLHVGGSFYIAGRSTIQGGDGEVLIEDGGRLDVEDVIKIWPLGRLYLKSGEILASEIVNLGRLASDQSVDALITNRGRVEPAGDGMLGAMLVVDLDGDGVPGGLTQESVGTIGIEIGSSAHDSVDLDGAAVLGGLLEVELIDGFMPPVNASYTVLSAAGGVTGEFEDHDLPPLDFPRTWEVEYQTDRVILHVVVSDDFVGGNGEHREPVDVRGAGGGGGLAWPGWEARGGGEDARRTATDGAADVRVGVSILDGGSEKPVDVVVPETELPRVSLVDVNRDGRPDVVARSVHGIQPGRTLVLVSRPDGEFDVRRAVRDDRHALPAEAEEEVLHEPRAEAGGGLRSVGGNEDLEPRSTTGPRDTKLAAVLEVVARIVGPTGADDGDEQSVRVAFADLDNDEALDAVVAHEFELILIRTKPDESGAAGDGGP